MEEQNQETNNEQELKEENITKSSNKKKIIVTSVSGLLLCALIVGSGFAFKYIVDGKVAPGTKVAGLDLSYKDMAEAEELLKFQTNKYLNQEISFNVQGNTYNYSPKNLGINIDSDQTFAQVSPIDSAKASVFDLVMSEEQELTIDYQVDYLAVFDQLDQDLLLSEKAPQPATIYYKNDGTPAITEGRNGYLLDEEKFLQDLENSIKNLDSQPIEVNLIEAKTAVTAADLEPQIDQVIASLDKEIILEDPIYTDDWYINLKDNPEWTNFVTTGKEYYNFLSKEMNATIAESLGQSVPTSNNLVTVKVNPDTFNTYIDQEIAPWLELETQNVKIYMEDDKPVIEGKGKDGRKIERQELMHKIEQALASDVKTFEVPVSIIEPEMEIAQELQDLGITERISVGHTSFYGSSANRKYNIELGSSKFNGHLVAPGEEFSFNTTLGPVDYANGYRAELVIKGGNQGTRPEPGGGLCQVSTTVYRAALNAGFPITDRRNHSYKVSYYAQVAGDGLDATIYIGAQDLKFVNDTKDHVLFQTFLDKDYEMYVVVYGTNPDGRQIELEGPYLSNYRYPGPTVTVPTPTLAPGATKQVEKSHVGFDALWYRHITYDDGTTVKEPIESNYRAIPARVLVGAGAAEPTE